MSTEHSPLSPLGAMVDQRVRNASSTSLSTLSANSNSPLSPLHHQWSGDYCDIVNEDYYEDDEGGPNSDILKSLPKLNTKLPPIAKRAANIDCLSPLNATDDRLYSPLSPLTRLNPQQPKKQSRKISLAALPAIITAVPETSPEDDAPVFFDPFAGNPNPFGKNPTPFGGNPKPFASVKNDRVRDLMPPYTGERRNTQGVGSWFAGKPDSSSANNNSLRSDNDMYRPMPPSSAQSPVSSLRSVDLGHRVSVTHFHSPAAPSNSPTCTSPSAGRRFSMFFGGRAPPTSTPTIVKQIPSKYNDEYLDLDIEKALFPRGPADRDLVTPQSFKNLLSNAEGTILRLQTAYKVQKLSLHEITTAKDTAVEDLEEANIRTTHVKLQLQEMAQQVASQDKQLALLKQQLRDEKRARAEEAAKYNRQSTQAKSPPPSHRDVSSPDPSEQLRRTWRESIDNYSGEQTDEDYSDDDQNTRPNSIFSAPYASARSVDNYSAATTPSDAGCGVNSSAASIAELVIDYAPKSTEPRYETKSRPQSLRMQSQRKIVNKEALQKLERVAQKAEVDLEGCALCSGKGGDAGVAWDTVGIMKAENRGLKSRVEELEGAVDGALDFILYGVKDDKTVEF